MLRRALWWLLMRMLDEYPLEEELRRKLAFENATELFPRSKGLKQ